MNKLGNKYQNWQKALNQLTKAIEILHNNPNSEFVDTFKDSIIQRFEFVLELSWNLQKIVANNLGFEDIYGPNPAIVKAFEIGLIENYEIWKQMLKSRNLTSHTYNQKVADEVILLIIEQFYLEFIFLEQSIQKYL
jgi:nucleotidyltransferase substrate binding protein (TIGR01987 family)